MPATVNDLDRTYTVLALRAAFECALVQMAEHLTQGAELRMFTPDYRAEQRVAEVFAEYREVYLGPEREKRKTAETAP